MEKKRLYHPGQFVRSFTGQAGVVISLEALSQARASFKEGKRPGHYFAPGCCHHPDYVTQIPVVFEDRTFDVMRTMNLHKAPDLTEEKRNILVSLLQDHLMVQDVEEIIR